VAQVLGFEQRLPVPLHRASGRSLVEHWQTGKELAHYARACVDIEFAFPFGVQELEGIAARSDFDLMQHQKHSGKSQEVFDEKLRGAVAGMDAAAREKFTSDTVSAWQARGRPEEEARAFWRADPGGRYVPHVIEPSAGVDRSPWRSSATRIPRSGCRRARGAKPARPSREAGAGRIRGRTVLRFHPRVRGQGGGGFPLLKNKPELVAKSREVFDSSAGQVAGVLGRSRGHRPAIEGRTRYGTPFG